jgi:hypothetical protein
MTTSRAATTFFSIILVMGLAACSSGSGGGPDPGPDPGPGPGPGPGEVGVTFNAAVLSGAQEVPPVATNGTGSAEVVVFEDDARIELTLNLAGTFTSEITRAHFHAGGPGENGGIVLNICGEDGVPDCPQAGTFEHTYTLADTTAFVNMAQVMQAIQDGVYINVHTVNNPPGEIRGQLGPVLFNTSVTQLQVALRNPDPFFAVDEDGELVTNTVRTDVTGFFWAELDPTQSQLEFELTAGEIISASLVRGIDGVEVETLCGGSPCAGTVAVDPATVEALMTGDAYVHARIAAGPSQEPVAVRGQLDPAMLLAEGQTLWLVRAANDPNTLPSIGTRAPTLEDAQANSQPGDIIFVYAGNTPHETDGVVLKSGQKLIGEGVGLALGREVIVPAGDFPLVNNANLDADALDPLDDEHLLNEGVPVVMLNTRNLLTGMHIHAVYNDGVLATGGTAHRITNNIITTEFVPDVEEENGEGNNEELDVPILEPLDGIRLQGVRRNDGSGASQNVVEHNAILAVADNGILLVIDAEGQPMDGMITLRGNAVLFSGGNGIYVDFTEDVTTEVMLRMLDNIIAGSTREGVLIDVASRNGGIIDLLARVQRNTLRDNREPHFLATINDDANMCLELIDNDSNATVDAYEVANNGGGLFQFFQRDNTGSIEFDPEDITIVAEGTCRVP